MQLWRICAEIHARDVDGGFGLLNDGRWNFKGRPLTYTSTAPSLCILEKLVHVVDPAILPVQVLVTYDVPDTLFAEKVDPALLPPHWRKDEGLTQQIGTHWLDGMSAALLHVPSVIVSDPDHNVLINNLHPAAKLISIRSVDAYTFDPRLLVSRP